MRRQEILEGVPQVADALLDSGVSEGLQSMMNRMHAPNRTAQTKVEELAAFKRYLIAAQGYNAAAKFVVANLDLEPLEEPEFWAIGDQEQKAGRLISVFQSVKFATTYLPGFAKLIRQEQIPSLSNRPNAGSRDDLLTLILPEAGQERSTPQRVVDALTAISLFYEAAAAMEGKPDNTLSVVGCDSGSDKSFDFLGAAELIENVRKLVLDLYDRVIFYRELKVERSLELMASSLPILEKVSALEQQSSLGPEQAAKIRRKVMEGAGKFLSCGAMIPEMKKHSSFDPRQLLAPEPKLLTSGIEAGTKQEDELTTEEKEKLDELLRKAGRSTTQ